MKQIYRLGYSHHRPCEYVLFQSQPQMKTTPILFQNFPNNPYMRDHDLLYGLGENLSMASSITRELQQRRNLLTSSVDAQNQLLETMRTIASVRGNVVQNGNEKDEKDKRNK